LHYKNNTMTQITNKYYSNLFPISDLSRKTKFQELFLRSIRNDIRNWTKIIQHNDVKGVTKKITTNTKFFSPNYDGNIFQFDYDKGIGIVTTPNNNHELVFDYADYKGKKYPDEIRDLFVNLTNTVFTSNINKLDSLIPNSSTEIAKNTRSVRSEKLKKIWGEK